MSNLSNSDLFNFAPYGYKLIKQLGSNYSGGRKTCLCSNLTNNEQVVIKLFYFNNGENDWSGFKALEKEVEVLKRLNHKRVPQYLDSFETDQGFCLVYRYMEGSPLSTVDLTPNQVHSMAIAILEILVYLQSRGVIHRDLKPENIVLGEDGEYYLIDFGFSSVEQNGSIRASSVVAGTMGFMTVEQLFSKSVNQSTDLYALGVTLFCKLMRITSSEVGKFIDSRVQLPTSELKQIVSREWLLWLDGLLQNDYRQRTPNAKAALADLRNLSVLPTSSKLEKTDLVKTIELYRPLRDKETRVKLSRQAKKTANYDELEELAQNFNVLKLQKFLNRHNDVYRSTLIVYKTLNPKQKVMTGFRTKHFIKFNCNLLTSHFLNLCSILCFLPVFTLPLLLLFSVITGEITAIFSGLMCFVMMFLAAYLKVMAEDISTEERIFKETTIKIKASEQIKLPELHLLFKEFEAMKLSPKLILTLFPSSLQIDIELKKKPRNNTLPQKYF